MPKAAMRVDRDWVDFADAWPRVDRPCEVGRKLKNGDVVLLAEWTTAGDVIPILNEMGEHCKASTMTHWRYI